MSPLQIAPLVQESHMTPFIKERSDWQTCLKLLRDVQLNKDSKAASLADAILFAKHYSERQYPSYQMNKFPTSFQATDNVVMWGEKGKILLGRKDNSILWRFPGGFVDPEDECLETSAMREREEECSIEGDKCRCSYPKYIFSFRVPDPRYENSPDKIMSAVFLSHYICGTPKGGDDLPEVKWFSKRYIRSNYKKMLEPCHHPLIENLIRKGYL